MKYIFNVQMKQISREEFNEQFSNAVTNLILLLTVCNLLWVGYMIVQIITGQLLLFPALTKAIKITIPFALIIMTLDGLEELLFLQYKDLPVGIGIKSAIAMKCLKAFGPLTCWMFVAIVYL